MPTGGQRPGCRPRGERGQMRRLWGAMRPGLARSLARSERKPARLWRVPNHSSLQRQPRRIRQALPPFATVSYLTRSRPTKTRPGKARRGTEGCSGFAPLTRHLASAGPPPLPPPGPGRGNCPRPARAFAPLAPVDPSPPAPRPPPRPRAPRTYPRTQAQQAPPPQARDPARGATRWQLPASAGTVWRLPAARQQAQPQPVWPRLALRARPLQLCPALPCPWLGSLPCVSTTHRQSNPSQIPSPGPHPPQPLRSPRSRPRSRAPCHPPRRQPPLGDSAVG